MDHSMLSKFPASIDALKQGVRTAILTLGGQEGFSSLPLSTQLKFGAEVVRSEVRLMKYAVGFGALSHRIL